MKHVCAALLMLSVFFSATLLADEQSSTQKNVDPWRGLNEKTHAFNEFLDRNLLKPVAQGYQKITPAPLNKGITNFFNNLKEPITFANDLLQGKPKDSVVDLGRFTVNSTVGLLGFFDVATRLNWQRNKEDFGQTLGKWGVPSGPYLVLPFLGPSTLRDGVAKVPEYTTNLNPIVFATDSTAVLIGAGVISAIDTRADLLETEKILFGNRYTSMRDFYLQTREFDVKDGQIEDDFMSGDFDW